MRFIALVLCYCPRWRGLSGGLDAYVVDCLAPWPKLQALLSPLQRAPQPLAFSLSQIFSAIRSILPVHLQLSFPLYTLSFFFAACSHRHTHTHARRHTRTHINTHPFHPFAFARCPYLSPFSLHDSPPPFSPLPLSLPPPHHPPSFWNRVCVLPLSHTPTDAHTQKLVLYLP